MANYFPVSGPIGSPIGSVLESCATGSGLAPTFSARNNLASVSEGAIVIIDVAANDIAPTHGLNLNSIVIISDVTHGSTAVNGDGTVTYTHDDSENFSDSFTYTIQNNNAEVSNIATVGITVVAINDNAPVFTSPNSATVQERTTGVLTVAASDIDNSALTFSINGTGADDSLFQITGPGVLTFIAAPDFETPLDTGTNNFYDVKVDVTDGIATVTQDISIEVTDVAENPVANNDSATVLEGGTIIITVLSNDTDPQGDIDSTTVAIVSQGGNGVATANGDGTITYVHSGSDTVNDTFTYTVDDVEGNTSASATVSMTITPTFDIGSVSDTDVGIDQVSEAASIGTVVGVTAFADDPDSFDTVTYSLSNDAGGLFQIHATSGVVTTAAALDYESSVNHTIEVTATSTDSTTSVLSFVIAVLDDTTEFSITQVLDSDAGVNEVEEGSATNTVVGITAQATDADPTDVVSYSLTDTAGGRFKIDSSSGIVTVDNGSLLIFAAATSHNITIRATSTDSSFTEVTTAINVLEQSILLSILSTTDSGGIRFDGPVGAGAPALPAAATVRYVETNETKLFAVPAGGMRVKGARPEFNLASNSVFADSNSDDQPDGHENGFFTGTKQISALAGVAGHNKVRLTATNQRPYLFHTNVDTLAKVGDVYQFTIYVEAIDVAPSSDIFEITGATGTWSLGTGLRKPTSVGRFSAKFTVASVTGTMALRYGIGAFGNSTGDITLSRLNIEKVTNRVDQNPSDYVPTGLNSAPLFNGFGVDGLTYSTIENPNTVDVNGVVTRGSEVALTAVEGYFSEPTQSQVTIVGNHLDPSSWSKGALAVITDASGSEAPPLGKPALITVNNPTASQGNNFIRVHNSGSSAGVSYSAKFMVKRVNWDFICFRIITDVTKSPIVNLDTLVVTHNPDSISITMIPRPDGWIEVQLTQVETSNGTSWIEVYAAVSGTDNTETPNPGAIDGTQYLVAAANKVQSSSHSSWIEGSTRAADYPVIIPDTIPDSQGYLRLELIMQHDSSDLISGGDMVFAHIGNNRRLFYVNSVPSVRFLSFDGSNAAISPAIIYSKGDKVSLHLRWDEVANEMQSKATNETTSTNSISSTASFDAWLGDGSGLRLMDDINSFSNFASLLNVILEPNNPGAF